MLPTINSSNWALFRLVLVHITFIVLMKSNIIKLDRVNHCNYMIQMLFCRSLSNSIKVS